MRLRGRWILATCLVVWAGCSSKPPAGSDAGPVSADSGVDAGQPAEAEADGGLDGGVDAGVDAGSLHVIKVADVSSPFDAVPNPADGMVYFTAFDETSGSGVFKAPADGSNTTPVPVCVGDPFATPFALVLSPDGKTVYVADSSSSNATDDDGAVFACPAIGGTPAVVSGSAGLSPLGLTVRQVNDATDLLIAGLDPANGAPGVLKLPLAGGTKTVIAEGAPFVDPEAVVSLPNGDLLVLDMLAADTGGAAVIRVSNGVASILASGFDPGWPGGIAFDVATGKALLSAFVPGASGITFATLDPTTRTLDTRSFTSPDALLDPGGLHAAFASESYAFVDGPGGQSNGRVYVISH